MEFAPPPRPALMAAGLNLIAQALTIYDQDLRLAVCNGPFQQMFDLPDTLVTPGATFQDTIRHLVVRGEYGAIEDIEAFVSERVRTALAFEPHYMERTRANGRIISVEGAPLPQGGWVTVYTDITRTKAQEALLRARSEELLGQLSAYSEELTSTNRELAAMNSALEATRRQLVEMEARTRLTTEMMPAHIAHVNAEGFYIYSNRQLASVMPGRPTNIVGHPIDRVLGPETYDRIRPNLKMAFNGKASVFEFTDVQTARRIRTAFTPDTHGGAYILSTDVTAEMQTRVALQQTRRRELAAQMTSGLAHDFSNLLTIILGLQSKLSRVSDLPEEAQTLIDGTLAAARRGGTLLSSIAGMTAKRELRPRKTTPSDLLQDLETLARPTLPEGIRLKAIHDGPFKPVLLDAGMVQDCLLNLILNARDACGGRGEISIRMRLLHNTWIEWTVQDTGPGFSPLALKRGLDPFFTTKGAEGSGLGLPMVYDMIKLSGGDLRIANTDQGARVILRLPYRPAIEAPSGLVMLVEDRDDLRQLYRDMLMTEGFSVIEAASVDEATAITGDLPEIGLILSDIQVEGEKTGLDLITLGRKQNIPIVLMSSLPSDHPLCCEAQKQVPLLRKPFTIEALSELLSPLKDAAE